MFHATPALPLMRGGMGTVWLAERADGLFTRREGLKLVHQSMGGRGGRRAVARERNLASLDHPTSFSARCGVTDAARRNALEYVEGTRQAYCDDNMLPLRARLRRSALASGPVAHANLVIHRD